MVGAIFLSFFHPAYSQNLPFEYYSTTDGLPSSRITALYQDFQGYLWIGTDNGLAVYDGIRFKTYGIKDGLPLRYVMCVLESRKTPGRYFIGTHGGGLAVFENGQFQKTIRLDKGFAPNIVQRVLEDHEGALWCQTAVGAFRVRKDSVEAIFMGSDSEGGPFIFQTGDSLIWMSLKTELHHYNLRTDKLEPFELGVEHAKFTCSVEENNGTLWLGSSNGMVYQLRLDSVIAVHKSSEHYIRDMLDDGEGFLWLTTWKGIIKIQKKNFPNGEIVQYGAENGLSDADLFDCLIDREGNLWYGHVRDGLIKLSKRHIYTFDRRPTLGEGKTQPAIVETTKHLFVNADDGLWEFWKPRKGGWQRFLHPLSEIRKNGDWFSVCADNKGRVWLAVQGHGLYGYEVIPREDRPSALRLQHIIKKPADLLESEIHTMMIDQENQLWLAFSKYGRDAHNRRGGVIQIDLNTVKLCEYYTAEHGLPSGNIIAMSRDQQGNIWFGGFSGGIFIFKPDYEKFVFSHKLTKADGLIGDDISTILARRNGEMWIGTRFNGISIYQNGQFQSLTSDDGLLNDVVRALAEDDSGRVWIGTSAGVQYTAPDHPRRILSHKKLAGQEFGAIVILPETETFFGLGWKELMIYEFGKKNTTPVSIPVSIAHIRINGKDVFNKNGNKEFTFGENLYEIDFVGVSLRDEDALRYDYKLVSNKGVEWSGTTHQRTVQYTSLQPGQYTFDVWAVNSEGVKSTQPASLSFAILPPFWQRWWFFALAIFCFGALFYAIHRFRLQRALAIEKIRSRIATDLHDDIGAGLTHIGLLSEVTLRQAGVFPGNNGEIEESNRAMEEMRQAVARMGDVARELSGAMSDVVWSINPKHDSVAALFRRLKAFANTICQAKNIKLKMEVSERISNLKLHPEVRRNLLLIAKEALHNMVKYSGSQTVEVCIEMKGTHLTVAVEDQGKGFDLNGKTEGNGLQNMRGRAEKLGGQCEIFSATGQGTRVLATVPHRM